MEYLMFLYQIMGHSTLPLNLNNLHLLMAFIMTQAALITLGNGEAERAVKRQKGQ